MLMEIKRESVKRVLKAIVTRYGIDLPLSERQESKYKQNESKSSRRKGGARAHAATNGSIRVEFSERAGFFSNGRSERRYADPYLNRIYQQKVGS